jgi:hypothetical protein
MSWSELAPSASGQLPALPLRELILAALAGMAANLRAETGFCTDCGRAAGGLCPDHRDASAEADDYEAAYNQVAAGSGDWCDLAVALASGMN